jgi:hypothetical protein
LKRDRIVYPYRLHEITTDMGQDKIIFFRVDNIEQRPEKLFPALLEVGEEYRIVYMAH